MEISCAACGTVNPEGSAFCHTCGTPIAATPAPTPPPSPATIERDLRRTKMGLYLLALSFLLAWLPAVGLVGLLFLGPGGLLVVSGRNAFGKRHAARALWGVVIFFLAILCTGVLLLLLYVAGDTGRPSVDLASIRGILVAYLWGNVLATALYSASAALLLSDLVPARGKILLLVASGLAVAGAALAAAETQALLAAEFVGQAPADQVGERIAAFLGNLPLVYSFPGALAFAAACVLPTILVARGQLPRETATPPTVLPPFTDLPPRA